MVKALVVGYGSIGERHAAILTELGVKVSVVSRRAKISSPFPRHATIEQALAAESLDLIVIANETSLHLETLQQVQSLGFQNKILVEKPIVNQFSLSTNVNPENVYVAYNLRFHPLLSGFADEFKKSPLLSAWLYCGQYLPNWRKQRDYTQVYSSHKQFGGGVLRDLSHEIDLIHLWQPGVELEFARGGHWSGLETDTDDHFILNFSARGQKGKPNIGLHLNCVDRLMQRNWTFNFEHESFAVDLNCGIIRSSKHEKQMPIDRNESYRRLHQALLWDNGLGVCTYAEGMRVCQTIAQAEQGGLNS